MTITAAELAAIRDWVPTTWAPTNLFDDTAVGLTWDRLYVEAETGTEDDVQAAEDASLANVYEVALALTRRFKAVIQGDPDSFSIGGEYSESRGASINALMAQIGELTGLRDAAVGLVTGTGRVSTLQVCRPNWHGR